MNLNIKSEEAHRLAVALAKAKGTTITEAVTEAVRKELEWSLRRTNLARDIKAITAKAGPMLKGVPASWEIDEFLYDEMGLPK
ncbi:MAG TPA: type II toxin-antitoxin system VapB family antitoxin [Chakrabartia sp.]|jgi:hypothetical protein|nr:type II toxin-antitoxin system VapB family antitoxin [Chakrabartia sp.]